MQSSTESCTPQRSNPHRTSLRCYMKVRERVAMGEILPEWIKGKSNSSDLLTKMVTKDVVDALMKTL